MLVRTHLPGKGKKSHGSSTDLALSSFLIEGLYHLRHSGPLTVNAFGGLRYWYEKAPSIDAKLGRAIPHRARKDYRHPQDDEFITEAYCDISGGPWQILIGKQIVVWGETDIVRTADVVNPLDLRYSIPGIDFWEEIKQGLWMLRGFYKTGLPGDLLIECLFIPGDFRHLELPCEGSHWGISRAESSLYPRPAFGYGHWLLEKMRRDAPGWSLKKNYEWGLRIRGSTCTVDWTLLYFDTLSDTPTADPARALAFSMHYLRDSFRLPPGTAPHAPDFPGYRVFRYKRYKVLGGTAQIYAERLHGSIWRLEWFYEKGQHFNKARDGQTIGLAYDEVRRDSCGLGLAYADKFSIPFLTHRMFDDKQVELTLTLFYEKILGGVHDLVVDASRGHRTGASHSSAFIWNIMQPLCHQTLVFVFAGSYNPNGMYFLLPMFSYAPGNHWRWEAGAAVFGYRSSSAIHPYHDKDSIILRMRYEW